MTKYTINRIIRLNYNNNNNNTPRTPTNSVLNIPGVEGINLELNKDNDDNYNNITVREIKSSDKIIKEVSILKNILLLINEKKINLKRSKNILELKYNKYKKCYNGWNISTILLSSILTLIESTKLVFSDN